MKITNNSKGGFTLIELLAVIGIISVMAVVIGTSLGGTNATISLGNGQRIAAGLFQSARSIAIIKQTQARVIIYKEGPSHVLNDSGKQLRFMGVVFKDENGEWVPANSGIYLPEGVYYVGGDFASGSSYGYGIVSTQSVNTLNKRVINYLDTGDTSDDPMNFSVSYPVFSTVPEDSDQWYFYEYDSRGLSENPGAFFVIAAAQKDAPANEEQLYSLNFDNEYAFSGFAIRKLGGVSMFTALEDID